MPASIDSLDTISSASDTYDDDDGEALLEKEWQESMEQLQQLVAVVLLPFFGKWLGRRWSHWAFARYVRLGLGKSFFLGERTISQRNSSRR